MAVGGLARRRCGLARDAVLAVLAGECLLGLIHKIGPRVGVHVLVNQGGYLTEFTRRVGGGQRPVLFICSQAPAPAAMAAKISSRSTLAIAIALTTAP